MHRYWRNTASRPGTLPRPRVSCWHSDDSSRCRRREASPGVSDRRRHQSLAKPRLVEAGTDASSPSTQEPEGSALPYNEQRCVRGNPDQRRDRAAQSSYVRRSRLMAGRLAEKVIVVTGAARGIGRGCAEMLAREGARVVIGDVRAAEATAVV